MDQMRFMSHFNYYATKSTILLAQFFCSKPLFASTSFIMSVTNNNNNEISNSTLCLSIKLLKFSITA